MTETQEQLISTDEKEELVSGREGYATQLSQHLFKIHGVAIGEDDVTLGRSGIRKRWVRETLEPAAETLEGQPIVVNHENRDVFKQVGIVTSARYEPGVGVLYEGEIDDDDLARRIDRGWLDVSPRLFHEDPSQMEEDDEGNLMPAMARFDNLSIVTQGAAPSNTVQMGTAEMSKEELQQAMDFVADEVEGTDVPETVADLASQYDVDVEDLLERVDDAFDEEESERDSPTINTDLSWDDLRESGEWEQPTFEHYDEDIDRAAEAALVWLDDEPENFSDLALWVVDDNGNLALSGLRAAKSNVSELTDITEEQVNQVQSFIDDLGEEHFGDDWNETEEEQLEEDIMSENNDQVPEHLTRFDAQIKLMDASPEELTLVPEGRVEQLETAVSDLEGEKSDLETQIEELEDAKEELETDIEEMSDEIETVASIYAEALSEATGLDEETLVDRFDVEELRAEYERRLDDDEVDPVVGEEELEPDVQSGDVDEGDEPLTEEELEEIEVLEARIDSFSGKGGPWEAEAKRAEERLEELRG